MKKLFAIAALVAAMFTVNATEANAQLNWNNTKAVNHRIHEVHVKDYLNKGDDEYRLGRYEAAMEAYKNARYHNNIDENIVPNRVIDQKMDRCADAMRRERDYASRNNTWHGSSNNTWHSVPSRTASYNANNDLVDVRSNGMFYTTTAANRGCRVLSVKNEFDYTVVEMEFINYDSRSTGISINGDTYLKDRNTGARYFLNETDGIRINASTRLCSGESQIFRLYFNRISGGCRSVDIIEPGTSSWKFYNVPVRM